MNLPLEEQLLTPDLFRFDSGEPIQSARCWTFRREEVLQHIMNLAYGDIPPVDGPVAGVELHAARVRQLPGIADARLLSMRVEVGGKHAFLLRIFVPMASRPLPVVLTGDGCWHYATDVVIAEVLRRGKVFAQFNRVEVAADPESSPGRPVNWLGAAGNPYFALAWWAWAYQRAVDVLVTLDFVNPAAIAVVGHSRGGKAALLAGANDARIALTSANNSGAGGAGCFRLQGPGSETLADLLAGFPHWMNPALNHFVGRENELPFDMHFLKALMAPRALLTTEALGDLWANPSGSWQTHLAAAKVYSLLGVPQNIACQFRSGGHDHSLEDWHTFLNFADSHLSNG